MQTSIFKTIALYLLAIIIWSVLFWNNDYLKAVLFDIHLIYSSTLIAYFIIRLTCSAAIMDFLKVFIRTIFKVWFLIFITFAISRAIDRIGIFLSLTFIFGYIEALFDINKWLESGHAIFKFPQEKIQNNYLHAFLTIQVMTMMHILSAVVIFVFSLFYGGSVGLA